MTKPYALVSGASSGIGLAIASALIDADYQVDGIARDFSAKDLEQLGKLEMDLSELNSLPTKLSKVQQTPRVLVLNAGYGQFGGVEQFSHSQIRRMIDTNLVSHLFLIKAFLAKMKQQGVGDIVLIGSESALHGAKAGAIYCATKFALRGLAQSLKADCSSANIRVILVNPGPVDSDFFDDLNFEPKGGDEFYISPDSVASLVMAALNQPRNVVVDEINVQPIKRAFKKKN